MSWCEHCRDHFDEPHHDANDMHKIGPQYGPYGADMVRRRLLDLMLGPDAVLWEQDDPRMFEVRRAGKHVGFISVLDTGEVVWV